MSQKDIGQQIRYYRQKLNLTQQELADRIGVTWEMISRYERGASSPLSRIDNISHALNVTLGELLDDYYKSIRKTITTTKVPLFTKIPPSGDFSPHNTQIYYSCPEWIITGDSLSFAVDADIITILSIQLTKTGIIYISPQGHYTSNNYILFWEKTNLVIDYAQNIKSSNRFIGKVAAQEIKFI